MLIKAAAVLLIVVSSCTFQAIQPPHPKICGSQKGPPITSPRIQLRDGRHLAYKEAATTKEKVNYKIIITHGLHSSKDFTLPSYDRAGYWESNPNPRQTVKSEAMDIQEVADQLEIGPKFYIIGLSMGAVLLPGAV